MTRFYLDHGHKTDGGALDEFRQVGIFVNELEFLLVNAGADVFRTQDSLDSFEGESDALRDLTEHPCESALYLACHANVGANRGLIFHSPSSLAGHDWATRIAFAIQDQCYRCDALSTDTPGYGRTEGCLARITADSRDVCGVLLEPWIVLPVPSDDAIREVARAVASALLEAT